MDQITCTSQATQPKVFTDTFLADVIKGLTAPDKYLESKYFYDDKGDELFRKIMDCPEYYPTKCEQEIFSKQTRRLANALTSRCSELDVVELGAGDATKSYFLLRELLKNSLEFTYYPVDISQNVIELLHNELPGRLPGLKLEGLNGEYFDMLKRSNELSGKSKLVMFLGGNIGNFPLDEAHHFCEALRKQPTAGDLLLIGFDLKKDPLVVLNAYNDGSGYTREFNLNLLRRINIELHADFNPGNFYHYPTYDPSTGACKSYLVSNANQEVNIAGHIVFFRAGEPVYMEISQKYTAAQTDELAVRSGFRPVEHLYDSKGWFLDAVWKCV